MKLPNIKNWTNAAIAGAKQQSPHILMGLGIAGMFTTVIFAVKATPKVLELINEAEKEKGDKLTPVEKVKTAWKPYIPAAATAAVSTACLLGANSIHTKRATVLTAAYKLSETALSEYKEAVIETVGEKKAEEVKEKIIEKRFEATPLNEELIVYTGTGNHLCYDHWSGMWFRSSYNAIKAAQNVVNDTLIQENNTNVSILYDEIGLPHTGMSDELGWDVCAHGTIEIEVTTKVAPNGEPCLVLDYNKPPVHEYWRL